MSPRPTGGPPRAAGPAPLASADGVTKRFGELLVVDGVDLTVAGGEVAGLIGANGSGKTTLIRMLLGLLAPTAGRVRLFGEPPSRRTRARLGYVPRSRSWETAFTALDLAGLPVSLVGRTLRVPAADPAEVHRLLADAGVPAEVAGVPASFEETFVVLAA